MISATTSGTTVQRLAVRLALATGLAAAALLATQSWVESRSTAATVSAIRRADVLVTARPIEAGSIIAASDLRWQRWPAGAIDASWLVRGASDLAIVGRVAPARLAAGVPITAAMAVAPGSGSRFAATIRPGWRAATIAVTPAAGLAGFVAPGDRVDVLLTQTLGNRHTVQTLLGDIGILGVDQRGRADSGIAAPIATAGDVVAEAAAAAGGAPPGLVTLEVTQRQAEALAVAAELGRLSLVLRGPEAGASRSGGVRWDSRSGGRRWDSDVTGLSAAQLAAGAPLAATPLPAALPLPAATDLSTASAAALPVATRARPPGGGVEVVYGLTPATPAPAAATAAATDSGVPK